MSVDGQTIGELGLGLVLLVGVGDTDTATDAVNLADKLSRMRIFSDDQGKMNLSITDVSGGCLVVSQFTLYADTRKGNRPSFIRAAAPEVAESLIQAFVDRLTELGISVATGKFGAHMVVSLTNDGPVTILLDSKETR